MAGLEPITPIQLEFLQRAARDTPVLICEPR